MDKRSSGDLKQTGEPGAMAHAVIPTTQEVEIRRIAAQSQPRQIVQETLS
jgi:hypothetical protein